MKVLIILGIISGLIGVVCIIADRYIMRIKKDDNRLDRLDRWG